MTYSAVFFGSIGVLTETSDLQRQAFNAAFAEAGLDWDWDPVSYAAMLHVPGGEQRIARYAHARGQEVDAVHLHMRKVRHFERMASTVGLTPRPGVVELMAAAQAHDVQIGFVTATGPDTVALVLRGLADDISAEDFAYIGNRHRVLKPKPSPDIYLDALQSLALSPDEVLAIEDTPESAEAALAAGITTIGYPGAAAQDRSFPKGVTIVRELGADMVWEPGAVLLSA